jgi:ribosomal protection tetracycline resistance protein
VPTLNLGILAHVDAGKTTLTERLLYAAGVIDEPGSVDAGSTRTDTLELERQRGITIKAAVVSFPAGDRVVNLIDTPGHPDFIAEVERALAVLDGVVLVISAVEGVQPQTRVLMRALARLAIPTLIFVNKIDRRGAGYHRILRDISARLTSGIVAMGTVQDAGTRAASWQPFGPADPGYAAILADQLTARDDALLAAYLAEESALTPVRLRAELAAQTRRAIMHPVFFGSAITGAGVDGLMAGIAELLPSAAEAGQAPVSGTVFKVERTESGEKVAYVRMRSGSVRIRQKLQFGAGGAARLTGISVFDGGPATPAEAARAGQIATLRGLAGVRVGDIIGQEGSERAPAQFAPPAQEAVVVPARPADHRSVHAALAQLAEQDPLINLRQDEASGELLVSLYGEVQRDVIQATLAAEFGLDIGFRDTTTAYVERLAGTGAAVRSIGQPGNSWRAGVGLLLEPSAPGSGIQFRLGIQLGSLPLAFIKAVEETAGRTLRRGRYGWPVTDCTVTLTHSGYTPPPPYGWSIWSSSGSDFRGLTPVVLAEALHRAGTMVCEPVTSFWLEVPPASGPAVLAALAKLRASGQAPVQRGSACVIEGEIPAGSLPQLRRMLPGLTGGEGVLDSRFARYQPVAGDPPVRPGNAVGRAPAGR